MTRFFSTPTGLVAKREITEAIRSRATKILLVVSLVAVVAMVVIAHLAGGSDRELLAVGIVGEPDVSQQADLLALGDAVGSDVAVTPLIDDDAARAAVADGEIDLAVLTDGAAVVTEQPISADDTSPLALLTNIVRSDLAISNGLRAAGLDDAAVDAVRAADPPPLESIRPADADDDEVDSSRIGTALAVNIVLFLLLQTYGGWVLQGVTREKSSRVIEVLMSAVSARQLLIGKVIGIGIVALVNAAVMVVAALVTARIVGLEVAEGFRAPELVIGGVWFVVGYAMYCSAFAAAGALCSRSEDAQGAALPVMLPLLAGYIVSFSAVGGASGLHWVLAFVPPTAVIMMPVLNAIGAAEWWHVGLSLALAIAFTVVVALLAAKIYERSVLRTGKRVSWRTALGRTPGDAAT